MSLMTELAFLRISPPWDVLKTVDQEKKKKKNRGNWSNMDVIKVADHIIGPGTRRVETAAARILKNARSCEKQPKVYRPVPA